MERILVIKANFWKLNTVKFKKSVTYFTQVLLLTHQTFDQTRVIFCKQIRIICTTPHKWRRTVRYQGTLNNVTKDIFCSGSRVSCLVDPRSTCTVILCVLTGIYRINRRHWFYCNKHYMIISFLTLEKYNHLLFSHTNAHFRFFLFTEKEKLKNIPSLSMCWNTSLITATMDSLAYDSCLSFHPVEKIFFLMLTPTIYQTKNFNVSRNQLSNSLYLAAATYDHREWT